VTTDEVRVDEHVGDEAGRRAQDPPTDRATGASDGASGAGAGGPGGGPSGGAAGVVARPSLRRPLTLLLASGGAIVGVVLLLVAFLTVGTRSIAATQAGDVPCLEAVSDEVPGASVHNSPFPPRTTCTWSPSEGTRETVLVAQASAGSFWTGAVLFVGGVVTCVGVLVAPRLRHGGAGARR